MTESGAVKPDSNRTPASEAFPVMEPGSTTESSSVAATSVAGRDNHTSIFNLVGGELGREAVRELARSLGEARVHTPAESWDDRSTDVDISSSLEVDGADVQRAADQFGSQRFLIVECVDHEIQWDVISAIVRA